MAKSGEIDPKRVAARKTGRREAELIFDCLVSWPDNYGADYAEAFLEELKNRLPQRADHKPDEKQLTPIARLGSTSLWYGEFKGQTFDDVPLDRLQWYLKVSEDNAKQLREYLTHPELESRRRGIDG